MTQLRKSDSQYPVAYASWDRVPCEHRGVRGYWHRIVGQRSHHKQAMHLVYRPTSEDRYYFAVYSENEMTWVSAPLEQPHD